MGWSGAVDVMQSMARLFVFNLAQVHPKSELCKHAVLPSGDVSVVCMDGFDTIRRVCRERPADDSSPPEESPQHRRFVQVCEQLGLPLNDGKRLIRERATGSSADPEAIGLELAIKLKELGAGEILKEIFDAVRPEA